MDHPPVRPRGAGRQRRQAAGRRPRRRSRRRGRGRAGAGFVDRLRRRLRHQPALRRPRPLRDGGGRGGRGGAQRGRGRRRPIADRSSRQFLLGQHGSAGGAGFAGAGGGGVPRCGPGLQPAVHQRQGQPQERVPRRRPQHRHPADAARQRLGPRAGRAPLRHDGPERARKYPVFARYDEGRDGRLALQPGPRPRRRRRAARGPGGGAAAIPRSCTRRSRAVWCGRATT